MPGGIFRFFSGGVTFFPAGFKKLFSHLAHFHKSPVGGYKRISQIVDNLPIDILDLY